MIDAFCDKLRVCQYLIESGKTIIKANCNFGWETNQRKGEQLLIQCRDIQGFYE